MRDDNKKYEREGTILVSKEGYQMKCVEYTNGNSIKVEFSEGCIVHTSWRNFNKGSVKNPLHKSMYGVGYIGIGRYKTKNNGSKHHKYYRVWSNMLYRCYSEKGNIKSPSYEKCTVSKEWHDFQKFSAWFEENHYILDNEEVELDKDILVKGNTVYSPETCIFAPTTINKCFIGKASSNRNYPKGVHYCKLTKRFVAQVKRGGKKTILGRFDIPEEAFQVYKQAKEKYIKEVAEEYKDRIPDKLYQALLKYEVEITD